MPERIQLNRSKGFKLQEISFALNGLPCVKVDRSTRFGNPFFGDYMSRDDAVKAYRRYVCDELWGGPDIQAERMKLREAVKGLRGKNLACWCKPGEPCHADVLLELANSPTPHSEEG